MGERTLVKVTSDERCICFRTVSRSRKSPQPFYLARSEFAKLETSTFLLAYNIWTFATLCRDDQTGTLEIEFTWLSGSSDNLYGWAETVTLPYDQLAAFVRDSAQEGGPKQWNALSMDYTSKRPQLIFEAKKTLHAVVENGLVRKKLARFLRDNFNWPCSERVHFYGDFVPYSFSFQEICNGRPGISGGLILHGQEDMSKAYYSVHT